jgi:hypothetical protein
VARELLRARHTGDEFSEPIVYRSLSLGRVDIHRMQTIKAYIRAARLRRKWSIVPASPATHGTAATLAEAKSRFRDSWTRPKQADRPVAASIQNDSGPPQGPVGASAAG